MKLFIEKLAWAAPVAVILIIALFGKLTRSRRSKSNKPTMCVILGFYQFHNLWKR